MKHFILTTMLALLTVTAAQAERRVETVTDSLNNVTKLIELDGDDTLSITTYEGTKAEAVGLATNPDTTDAWNDDNDDDYFMGVQKDSIAGITLISIMGIIFVFGLPIAIIFIIFYYRNKNRKAKYQLAEKILASGQPLPPNFFNEIGIKDLRSRGFSNTFLGLGLFIFLWATTGEFSSGCIGLLVLCIGLGQVVTHYTRERKKEETTPEPHTEQ